MCKSKWMQPSETKVLQPPDDTWMPYKYLQVWKIVALKCYPEMLDLAWGATGENARPTDSQVFPQERVAKVFI